MKRARMFGYFFAILVCQTVLFCAHAQDSLLHYNLGFEALDKQTKLPSGWDGSFRSGSASGYITQLDSTTVVEGRYSLSIFSDPEKAARSFGVSIYVMPAKYSGKTIQLKGFLRTANVSSDGFGGLWMRVDGESGMLAFDNMQERKITGTNDWKEYSIELPLSDEATNVVVGGLLVGTGKIWIDGLSVTIDGKEFSLAPPKKPKVYPAQLDSAFFAGSKIEISTLQHQTIKDLSLLCKIWGFLKYYHPYIADGNVNWDFELFRILPAVLRSRNTKERDRSFANWINKLGSVPVCDTCTTDLQGEYKLKPDLSWMGDPTLDSGLKKQLDFIHKNRNQKSHYYIDFAPGVGNPAFKHEDAYRGFAYPDKGFRLLALFRYWNMIQYFFPYKYAIQEDWNGVLDQFIPRFVNARDSLAYRLTALELIGRIHDTHANIWGVDSTLIKYKGIYRAPVQVKFIEGKAVVSDYYNKELGVQSGLKIGDIVLAVNNVDVQEIVEKRVPIYPASNFPTKLRDIAKDLLRGNSKTVEVTVQRGDEKLGLSIQREDLNNINTQIDGSYRKPDTCYRFITNDIGYIYLGNIQSALLPTIFEKFKKTKGIVIDIRNYPSDFVVFSLGKYLVSTKTEFVKFTQGVLSYPGLFQWTPALSIGEDNPDYYRGKVAILVNEMTLSQAEYTTMAFRSAKNAIVIGSTTAAADGNVSRIYLPGNISTLISGIGVYYPDGGETQRVGIIPNIEVKPTIKGIKEGRDEVLDKAIEVIQSQKM